jgi:hypothetical protein
MLCVHRQPGVFLVIFKKRYQTMVSVTAYSLTHSPMADRLVGWPARLNTPAGSDTHAALSSHVICRS